MESKYTKIPNQMRLAWFCSVIKTFSHPLCQTRIEIAQKNKQAQKHVFDQ